MGSNPGCLGDIRLIGMESLGGGLPVWINTQCTGEDRCIVEPKGRQLMVVLGEGSRAGLLSPGFEHDGSFRVAIGARCLESAHLWDVYMATYIELVVKWLMFDLMRSLAEKGRARMKREHLGATDVLAFKIC